MSSEYEQLRLLAEDDVPYSASNLDHQRGKSMKTYTKDSLIAALRKIRDRGWIPNARPGNAGGVGNTLEDLLGIKENNLPLPNAGEWELKAKRQSSAALTTLFHSEPSPTAFEFVTQIFLPKYGWPHEKAGTSGIPEGALSFRQTMQTSASDRGFKVVVDGSSKRVLISFDARSVDARHSGWLESVKKRAGLGEIDPQPYWGFDDLYAIARTKLRNCFYVLAKRRKAEDSEFFWYTEFFMASDFNRDKFLAAIENGTIYVDFDARSGHNHGTKFRTKFRNLSDIYDRFVQL